MHTRSLIAVAALIFASAGGAAASHTAPGGGPHDFAVGSGRYVNSLLGSIELSGHQNGPDGATGFVVRSPQYKGHVTCIRVEGNRATIAYDVEDDNGVFAGRRGMVWVEDNGQPSDAIRDVVQHASLAVGPTITDCPQPMDLRNDLYSVDGNVTVHDAG